MIPRRLIRSIPEETTAEVEGWWEAFKALHPGWDHVSYRDPVDPARFPITSPLWHHCAHGAQMAGLLRLEVLWHDGGVWIDSDVEPYRCFEPLMGLDGFAAYEDERVVPDAILGASAGHPAVRLMLTHALAAVAAGKGAWESGPGATTTILPGRSDWLLLPPGSFYPYHYLERARRHEDHRQTSPWAFCAHHWQASWLSPAQKAQLDRLQRPLA